MASDEVIVGIMIVFFTLLMALAPVGMQFKSEVNNGAFRLIKIKKFAFMFRAPNGISVSKEGVAVPLFVVQVAGYLIAILSIPLNILLLVLLENPMKAMAIVTATILGAEILFLIVFTVIVGRISKTKNKNNR